MYVLTFRSLLVLEFSYSFFFQIKSLTSSGVLPVFKSSLTSLLPSPANPRGFERNWGGEVEEFVTLCHHYHPKAAATLDVRTPNQSPPRPDVK